MGVTAGKRGGKRPGAGRPKGSTSSASLIGRKVYLTRQQWEYLALWDPTGKAGHQIGNLADRAASFWPRGPRTNPRMNAEQLATYAGEGQ